MNKKNLLPLAAAAALLAGCAAGPSTVARSFPDGARTPAAAELASLLRGHTYDAPTRTGDVVRTAYAADADKVSVSFSGGSDNGTWQAQDGRVCYQFQRIASSCSDFRLVGADFYMKRANGDVVRLTRVP